MNEEKSGSVELSSRSQLIPKSLKKKISKIDQHMNSEDNSSGLSPTFNDDEEIKLVLLEPAKPQCLRSHSQTSAAATAAAVAGGGVGAGASVAVNNTLGVSKFMNITNSSNFLTRVESASSSSRSSAAPPAFKHINQVQHQQQQQQQQQPHQYQPAFTRSIHQQQQQQQQQQRRSTSSCGEAIAHSATALSSYNYAGEHTSGPIGARSSFMLRSSPAAASHHHQSQPQQQQPQQQQQQQQRHCEQTTTMERRRCLSNRSSPVRSIAAISPINTSRCFVASSSISPHIQPPHHHHQQYHQHHHQHRNHAISHSSSHQNLANATATATPVAINANCCNNNNLSSSSSSRLYSSVKNNNTNTNTSRPSSTSNQQQQQHFFRREVKINLDPSAPHLIDDELQQQQQFLSSSTTSKSSRSMIVTASSTSTTLSNPQQRQQASPAPAPAPATTEMHEEVLLNLFSCNNSGCVSSSDSSESLAEAAQQQPPAPTNSSSKLKINETFESICKPQAQPEPQQQAQPMQLCRATIDAYEKRLADMERQLQRIPELELRNATLLEDKQLLIRELLSLKQQPTPAAVDPSSTSVVQPKVLRTIGCETMPMAAAQARGRDVGVECRAATRDIGITNHLDEPHKFTHMQTVITQLKERLGEQTLCIAQLQHRPATRDVAVMHVVDRVEAPRPDVRDVAIQHRTEMEEDEVVARLGVLTRAYVAEIDMLKVENGELSASLDELVRKHTKHVVTRGTQAGEQLAAFFYSSGVQTTRADTRDVQVMFTPRCRDVALCTDRFADTRDVALTCSLGDDEQQRIVDELLAVRVKFEEHVRSEEARRIERLRQAAARRDAATACNLMPEQRSVALACRLDLKETRDVSIRCCLQQEQKDFCSHVCFEDEAMVRELDELRAARAIHKVTRDVAVLVDERTRISDDLLRHRSSSMESVQRAATQTTTTTTTSVGVGSSTGELRFGCNQMQMESERAALVKLNEELKCKLRCMESRLACLQQQQQVQVKDKVTSSSVLTTSSTSIRRCGSVERCNNSTTLVRHHSPSPSARDSLPQLTRSATTTSTDHIKISISGKLAAAAAATAEQSSSSLSPPKCLSLLAAAAAAAVNAEEQQQQQRPTSSAVAGQLIKKFETMSSNSSSNSQQQRTTMCTTNTTTKISIRARSASDSPRRFDLVGPATSVLITSPPPPHQHLQQQRQASPLASPASAPVSLPVNVQCQQQQQQQQQQQASSSSSSSTTTTTTTTTTTGSTITVASASCSDMKKPKSILKSASSSCQASTLASGLAAQSPDTLRHDETTTLLASSQQQQHVQQQQQQHQQQQQQQQQRKALTFGENEICET